MDNSHLLKWPTNKLVFLRLGLLDLIGQSGCAAISEADVKEKLGVIEDILALRAFTGED